MSERMAALRDWLSITLNGDNFTLEPASSDASARRYFRVRQDNNSSASRIVMDAPPAQEDCRPFVKTAALLKNAGIHVPEIVAQDIEQGFLLLSDLGTQTYLDVLNDNNADRLFSDAIDALINWQAATRADTLPPYDRELLHRELKLFPDWYLGEHLGITLPDEETRQLETVFAFLEDSALMQPQVFVHRDYMPRNLMLSTPNPGVIDFQDAVYGPISYDVLSLFKDAFISWSDEQVDRWVHQYHERARAADLPVSADYLQFKKAMDVMGIQRHLKVIGIFARIAHRDGKPQYLEDVPRFITYIRDIAPNYKPLEPLLALFDKYTEQS